MSFEKLGLPPASQRKDGSFDISKLSNATLKELLTSISHVLENVEQSNNCKHKVKRLFAVQRKLRREERRRQKAKDTRKIEGRLTKSEEKMELVQKWLDNIHVAPPTKIPLLIRGNAKKSAVLQPTDVPMAKTAAKSKIPVLKHS